MAREGAAAIAVLLTFFVAVAAADRPPASSELGVLAKVKAGLDPSGALLASWIPTANCSTWVGLACDQYGNVISMNFGPSLIFTGALVAAIGSLPNLTTLVVRTDGFVLGSVISASIGKLQQLQTLVLSGYTRSAVTRTPPEFEYTPFTTAIGLGLAGALPAGIVALPNLTYLDLSNNYLGGRLPSFAGAKTLVHLDLSGNAFVIDESIEFPPALPVANGGFSGTPTFGAGNSLEYLNLASNKLDSGDFTILTKLTYLNLSSNSLSGPLPNLAPLNKTLQTLDLSTNPGISGTLRDDYSSLTNLRVLSLYLSNSPLGDYSSVSGPIPSSYGNLSNLVTLSIESGSISSGSVDTAFPSTLGNLKKLTSLTVIGLGIPKPNTLPSFIGSLTQLQSLVARAFTGSEASGAFPANLVNLQNLTSLTLGKEANAVYPLVHTGNLPKFILSLKALQKLDLSQEYYSGLLWPNLSTLKNLTYLDLTANPVSGLVSNVLNANPNWDTVVLRNTIVGGALPSNIGSLKALRYLWVGGNTGVTGTLPASFSQLTNLEFLSLDTNFLNGPVPDLSATKLTVLNLLNNDFTGAVPKLPKTLQLLELGGNNFTSIPDVFQGLNALTFADFRGAGSIPALPPSLFALPKLQYLLATNLGLTSIPSNIGSLQALLQLDLSNNTIAQPLPAGLTSLKNINNLVLSNNFFTGSVPDLNGLPLVETLLNNNSLSGPLPKVGEPSDLLLSETGQGIVFFFGSNNFSGEVPSDYLSGLKQLDSFDVSYNQLTGPVPDNPITLFSFILNYSHNAFSGTLARDFFNLAEPGAIDLSYNQLSGPFPDIYTYPLNGYDPAVLDSNYFTGSPEYINPNTNVTTCVVGPIEFEDPPPPPPPTSLNCFSFQGTSCPVTPQRSALQCAAFCGDTSPGGPCAGNGVCSFNGTMPTCTCNPGYKTATANGVSTCVKD